MGSWNIPLSFVLIFQVFIVAASFTAVIVVLSELQRTEFEDSLNKQLSLQRLNSLQSVSWPLLQRKEKFNSYVQHYINGNLNDKVFAAPSDLPGAISDQGRMLQFYNEFYGFTTSDSMVRQIFAANQSLNSYPGYAVGGSKYNPELHNADNTKNTIWNIWTVDAMKAAVVQNESARACLGSYPLNFNTCPSITLYYGSDVAFGTHQEYNRTGGRRWGAPGMLSDPTVAGGLAHVYTYSVNIDVSRTPYLIFGISFSLDSVKPLIISSVSSTKSKAAVFAYYESIKLDTKEYYLVGGKFDFTDYDVETFTESSNDYFKSAWRGGRTPDPILNKVFSMAEPMLPNQTGSTVFDFSMDGTKFVGSMSRMVDSTSYMNWLLIEYTPREEFYGSSDRARLAGILIGVFGALLVLVTCIVIWLAIRTPLIQLRAGMALAAEMRNEAVKHIDPLLSEISDLGLAFRQMNAKLLAARPFLPQSLLQAGDTTQEEDEEAMGKTDNASDETDNDEDDKPVSSQLCTTPTMTRTTFSSHSDEPSSHRLSHSRTRVDTSTKRGAGRMHGMLALTRELENRRVGVLSINIIGFHQGLGGGLQSAAALLRALKTLAKIVEVSAGEERGIVDYFHGDHFVCGFNTSRLCGNSARSGAEAATKISERFLADSELVQAFPLGLAMGLGVGKAVVGNHGTDTMQRLATIGKVYCKAIKLQEVMSRRILFGQGSAVNPHPASRCLLMGRAVQDLQMCNIHCQILGGVPAEVFMPSSEARGDPKKIQSVASALNASILRQRADEVQNLNVSDMVHFNAISTINSTVQMQPTVLVACLVPRHNNEHHRSRQQTLVGEEEWLYEIDKNIKGNPYGEINAALHKLWIDGSIPALPNRTSRAASDPAVQAWVDFVINRIVDADSVDASRLRLTYN